MSRSSATPEEIIAKSKLKQSLWMLQQRQENMGESSSPPERPEEFSCPVCYDQMCRPDHTPITLFPCGHSVCESCLKGYVRQSGRQSCCVCRHSYSSTAVNFALLQLIENSARPKTTASPDFADSLRLAQARLALLLEQMRDCQARSRAVKSTLETETRVLNVLDDELRFVQERHAEQKTKVGDLRAENESLDHELGKLKSVVDPLLIEVQKLKLLVEGSTLPS
jgi:hypothetical protein